MRSKVLQPVTASLSGAVRSSTRARDANSALLSARDAFDRLAIDARRQSRSASTSAAATADASPSTAAAAGDAVAYPYAPSAVVRQRTVLQDAQVSSKRTASGALRTRGGLMADLNGQLRAQYDADGWRAALFQRGSKDIIPPGSIVNVETWTDASQKTFNAFAGMVLSIRRRNTSTSMTLRNLVNKTGVEMKYNIYSPLIKSVQVIQRAKHSKREGGLRRARRAKLYYVRDDDKRLPNVARAIQVQRAEEERRAARLQQQQKAAAGASAKA